MSKTIASTLAALVLGCSIAWAEGPADKVTFAIDMWRKPGSNNAGLIDITVNNANDFAIGGIRLRCDYMAKVGGKKIEAQANSADRKVVGVVHRDVDETGI